MTKTELIKKYKELGYASKADIAKSLGITPQAFNNWKFELPKSNMNAVIASFIRRGQSVPKEFL